MLLCFTRTILTSRFADHQRMHVSLSAGPRFGMWLIIVIALTSYPRAGLAQDRALIPDSSIPIPLLQFDSSGHWSFGPLQPALSTISPF